MNIYDILHEPTKFTDLATHCSQFINESGGLPVFRNLPTTYSDVQRVKARKRKAVDGVTETFNQAFQQEARDLGQRAVYVYGQLAEDSGTGDTEPFYVFPVNGYKFIYNSEVGQSKHTYQQALEQVIEQFASPTNGIELLIDLLKYTYQSVDLAEGISAGAEIIVYNIPHYYVVRSSVIDYDTLLDKLKGQ